MNVFELFGVISIDNKQANRAIGETTGLASTLGAGIGKIGRTAVTVGGYIGKGIAAGSVAMGKLMKDSVSAYAEYEQLAGGAKLMFGEAYDFINDKAANAYKNVQMSQTDYLRQVNGFATGLKKSLGGDAQAAADLADRIITAEADIVAATGQTQENVQNAFNGIMKNNFSMLDNLNIGITPTKKGFQDLIKQVNKWNKENGKATKYNINNLADCQAALLDYIEMQGLSGYASMEASETISGSVASMKASWKDLLVGVAGGTDDLGKLISNFASSVGLALKNVTKILPSISSGISQVIGEIAPMLPAIIQDLLPGLIEGATSLITGLASALPGLLQTLFAMLPGIIEQIVSTFQQIWPALLSSIYDGWTNVLYPAIQNLFKATLGIDLPEWSEIESTITSSWATLKTSIEGVCQWTLKLFDNPKEAIKDVEIKFSKWWTETGLPGVKKASTWVLSLFGVPIEDDATIAEHIGAWWRTKIDLVKNACSWVLKLFGVPDATADTITSTVAGWWKGVVQLVVDACNWILSRPEMPSVIEMVQAIGNWWNDKVVPSLPELAATVKVTIRFVYQNLMAGLKIATDPTTSVTTDGVHNFVNGQTNSVIDAISSPTISNLTGGQYGTVKKRAAGAIFSAPTIFDTRLGRQMVGEAGEEAVAPISVLRGYVREEVEAAVGNNRDNGMKEAFQDFANSLPDMLVNAFSSMKFDVNNREFARLVKAVN